MLLLDAHFLAIGNLPRLWHLSLVSFRKSKHQLCTVFKGFGPLAHYFKIYARELSYSLRVVAVIRAGLFDDSSKSISLQSEPSIYAKLCFQDVHQTLFSRFTGAR